MWVKGGAITCTILLIIEGLKSSKPAALLGFKQWHATLTISSSDVGNKKKEFGLKVLSVRWSLAWEWGCMFVDRDGPIWVKYLLKSFAIFAGSGMLLLSSLTLFITDGLALFLFNKLLIIEQVPLTSFWTFWNL